MNNQTTELTVNCADIEMDNGENLRALRIGNHLELDRPAAGLKPGTWLLTAYHGDAEEQATLRLLSASEVNQLRRSEALARIYE